MNLFAAKKAKVIAPICVLAGSVAVMATMIAVRPSAQATRPGFVAPVVSTIRALPSEVRLPIHATGTVEPRTESDLVTEVSGRIVWASPQLASGGFFDEGEVLLRIDPRDYEVALEGARASLARAQSDVAHAQADLDREKSMRKSGTSSRANLDDVVRDHAGADAALREARVSVRRAELDLERSEIRAPFSGRVREKSAGRGQYVARGAKVARVYAVDYAEVRLPISDADLAFLDLPMDPRTREGMLEGSSGLALYAGPPVVLSADFAGARHEWQGRIVRTEGALDSRTRMVTVVARVEDPYRQANDLEEAGASDRLPLPIGLFVEATIEGRAFKNVYEVPRSALRPGDVIWVVGTEGRLSQRKVSVLRSIGDRTFVRSGLRRNDRVVTSPLEIATDGMQVRPIEDTALGTARS